MGYIKMGKTGRRHSVTSFAKGADMRFDECVLPEGIGSACKNINFDSGALRDGYGLDYDAVYARTQVWSVWDFVKYNFDTARYETIHMLCNTLGLIYYDNGDGWQHLPSVRFSSPPRAFVYRLYGNDTVIMMSDTDGMTTWDGVGSVQKIENSPLITSHALHYERLFVTTPGEQSKVYFSDDLDPTNWTETLTEGGFIQLLDERGKLLKVLDFQNYIYIFREYGVSRLVAYADQQEFYVVNLYLAGGRIYAGSVAQAGSNIMLLASDGLYSFDGYDLTRRLQNIDFAPSPNASAVYFEGKYYVAARVKGFKGDDDRNNALIVYDMTSGSYAVSEMAIQRLNLTEGGVFGITYDHNVGKVTTSGYMFGVILSKSWESGYMDFGSPHQKELMEVSLTTNCQTVLKITVDDVDYDYVIQPSTTPGTIRPKLSGRKFKFKISTYHLNININRLSYVVR